MYYGVIATTIAKLFGVDILNIKNDSNISVFCKDDMDVSALLLELETRCEVVFENADVKKILSGTIADLSNCIRERFLNTYYVEK